MFLIKLKASNYFDTDDEDFSLSIKYAEDSRLLVLGFEKLEETTYELQKVCIKSGKKINFDKCRVLKPSVDYVLIQGEYTENVKKIVYVWSSIPNVRKDIKKRIAWGLSSFGWLQNFIWSNKTTLLKLKIRLY